MTAESHAPPEKSDFRYRAFLSYSHSDRKAGEWIHHALESYQLPKDIARPALAGPSPRQPLRPVFRDRFDLEAGYSLTEQITEALRQSEALVVICSPASARSRYVNEEIRLFKAQGRTHRVFPIIVAGVPGNPDQECFAPALRQEVLPDGTLGPAGEEPIAADARDEGDGRELALLKLVAGLLRLDLDELRKREEIERRRRQRRSAMLAMAMTVLAVVASASAVFALLKQREAAASEIRALAARDTAEAARKNADDARIRADEARAQAEAARAEAERRHEQAMGMNLKLVVTKATLESVTKKIPFQMSQIEAKGEDDEFKEFLNSRPNREHVWHRLAQVLIEFARRPPRQLSGFGKELEWVEHARLILRNLGDRPEYRADREAADREIARLKARSNTPQP